ncbi:PD-(D/E)XK motif protein [Rhodocyclus gracilis]|uniref:PD-(D/E)XK motif protein n=1 Tax=Rhodocyclus tenuis TaxID=1066 RepID=A0A6L5K198_RHOTE|nr:PD-(D/E)XK motif protein [Rhodocyclus gracilis]MQY52684.1 PD-(D/E)XK motif protein [Rhodocyclus gracilis]
MDLYDEFQNLAPAPSATEFAAVPIRGRRNDYLAKCVDGAPVFLIGDSSAAEYTPGATLKHLSVQFHATCRVQSSAGAVDGQFAVIACDTSVPELYELFVRCMGAAVEQLPDEARTKDIEDCVRSLLSLFRAMNGPSGREISGLWAELFVITQASDVEAAVTAWHADKFERFDFSWPDGVLEVKATQGAFRIHEFALEQLDAPKGQGFVASLLLQPLTNGVGIMDLAIRIDAALQGKNDLRQRLWANITAALGSEFYEKLDRRFDLSFAERHVEIFHMSDIPAPDRPSDPRVTGVRFRSDLTTVTSSAAEPALRMLQQILEMRGSVDQRSSHN